MGNITTTYDVQTRYLMQDQVSGGDRKMTTELHGAANASHSLKQSLMHLAGVVGVGFGVHAVYEKVKEANMELVNMQRSATAVHFAFNQWGAGVSTIDRMKESMQHGVEMAEKFEEMGRRVHMDEGKFVTIYESMAASGGKLGLTQERILDLTLQLGAATRVYGVDAGQAAFTVSRALETGSLRGVDNFTKMLRAKLNLKEEGKGIGGVEMVNRIMGGLGGTVEAASMMGSGIGGTMEDIHREVIDITRSLTGPAFRSVTTELHRWSTYMMENRKAIDDMATKLSGTIVGAMTTVKDITVFVYDHWKSMAALWVANKGLGMLSTGGALGGSAGAAGMGSRAGLGAVSLVASAVYIGSTEIVDWLEKRQQSGLSQTAVAGPSTMEQVRSAAAGMTVGANAEVRFTQSKILADALVSSGLASREGGVNKTALLAAMEAANIDPSRWEKSLRVQRETGDFGYKPELIVDALARVFERAVAKPVYDMMADVTQPWRMPGVKDAPAGTGKAPQTIINQHIEVVSDDPDRFAFGLDELVQTAASRRGITPGYLPPAWRKG